MRIVLEKGSPLPRTLPLLMVTALALSAGCGGGATGDDRLQVVASTSILGDMIGRIGGEGVSVEVLIPAGVDPHAYQPSAAQVALLRDAELVVTNGLGLEEGLGDVLAAARRDGVSVLEIGPAVDPLPFGDHDADEDHEGRFDPHVWFDPVRMATAVTLLGDALADLDGGAAAELRDAAATYRAEVLEVHEEVAAMVAGIPPAHRLLVTEHDSLAYFADRYGFDVVGVVISGGSTLAEPSAGDLADLVRTIVDTGVSAVLVDVTRPTDLADVVAAETGLDVVVVPLYTGSLGPPGSGAETYLSLLRTDAERITEALTR